VIFFLDQDVPDDLAHWLRHRGHTVTCLREVLPIDDAALWDFVVNRVSRLLEQVQHY
jgi:hypothetical protein